MGQVKDRAFTRRNNLRDIRQSTKCCRIQDSISISLGFASGVWRFVEIVFSFVPEGCSHGLCPIIRETPHSTFLSSRSYSRGHALSCLSDSVFRFSESKLPRRGHLYHAFRQHRAHRSSDDILLNTLCDKILKQID
jgi:hypothetical protein